MVIIPTIIEKTANSERVYDLYSRLLQERIILLTGEIDDNLSSSICAQLLYLSSLNNKDIQLYINSPGGSISAGLAIYDTMQFINCKISTICMGVAASMAAIILAGGSEKMRFALPHSEIMIHQPLGGIQGQARDIEIAASHILKVKAKLNEILSKHTLQKIDTLITDTDRDNFMNATEAKNYGLVDAILIHSNSIHE